MWNGARWLAQPAATPPAGGDLGFDGVACTALVKCMIVGQIPPGGAVGPPPSETFAERWNGTSWSVEPTPNPQPSVGAGADGLSGISCVAGTCIAVGSATSPAGQTQTLIEQNP